MTILTPSKKIGGARLMNISVLPDDIILTARQSFTFCLRFYLEILGTTADLRRGYLLQISGLLKIRAAFPNR